MSLVITRCPKCRNQFQAHRRHQTCNQCLRDLRLASRHASHFRHPRRDLPIFFSPLEAPSFNIR